MTYQQKHQARYEQATAAGNRTVALDAVWRAASAENLINETRERELTEARAAEIKIQLGWK
jgi:hypothetical protein